ncbi:hypothetical protein V7S43_015972 [Phytophthora oleae]|uniref:Uncharacterized protein n=1 Tax=Phytophthora oleae TaxID=2107226 RepID=A0ABD3EX91_9STRA
MVVIAHNDAVNERDRAHAAPDQVLPAFKLRAADRTEGQGSGLLSAEIPDVPDVGPEDHPDGPNVESEDSDQGSDHPPHTPSDHRKGGPDPDGKSTDENPETNPSHDDSEEGSNDAVRAAMARSRAQVRRQAGRDAGSGTSSGPPITIDSSDGSSSSSSGSPPRSLPPPPPSSPLTGLHPPLFPVGSLINPLAIILLIANTLTKRLLIPMGWLYLSRALAGPAPTPGIEYRNDLITCANVMGLLAREPWDLLRNPGQPLTSISIYISGPTPHWVLPPPPT